MPPAGVPSARRCFKRTTGRPLVKEKNEKFSKIFSFEETPPRAASAACIRAARVHDDCVRPVGRGHQHGAQPTLHTRERRRHQQHRTRRVRRRRNIGRRPRRLGCNRAIAVTKWAFFQVISCILGDSRAWTGVMRQTGPAHGVPKATSPSLFDARGVRADHGPSARHNDTAPRGTR